MIKLERTETHGWEATVRGMRNPLNSWEKSDSHYCWDLTHNTCGCFNCELKSDNDVCHAEKFWIGENDLTLMKKLAASGNDHGKFLRMITVMVDITAPLYWWKEFDTYKVGTVANSCSTMHKIQSKEFTLEDFSVEHLDRESRIALGNVLHVMNTARQSFNVLKDKKYWWQMIQLLPTSYNQKRTVQLNYAVLKNIYHSRRNHKLDEWHTFCDWIKRLPYSELITGGTDDDKQ